MVRAISAFMEFCYLVWRSVIDEDDLVDIDTAVANFHHHCVAFDLVHPDGYSLPCQHSLKHYTFLIKEFGAPNGLCSSITKSKHIKAIKEPWRCSSRFEALAQMLVTNQRLDKLAAAHVDFKACGMLKNPLFGEENVPQAGPLTHDDDDDDDDDDKGAVDDDILGEVILSQKPCKSLFY